MIYKIINWDTDEVMGEYDNLKKAARACKALGHTGKTSEIATGMFPVAYVIDDIGCVYNPRFKKVEENEQS